MFEAHQGYLWDLRSALWWLPCYAGWLATGFGYLAADFCINSRIRRYRPFFFCSSGADQSFNVRLHLLDPACITFLARYTHSFRLERNIVAADNFYIIAQLSSLGSDQEDGAGDSV